MKKTSLKGMIKMAAQEREIRNENRVQSYLYSSDKTRLTGFVSEMVESALSSIEKAVYSLSNLDLEMAKQVIEEDDLIDEKEEQIDQECLYSIAMRQPVREDLRFVYAVMKIIVDLERIGDQSVNIAMSVLDLPEGILFPEEIIPFVESMADENIMMIKEVMEAFVGDDETVICSAREQRRRVKTIKKSAFLKLDELLDSVRDSDSEKQRLFCMVILILRHLSRISDHALNLAERVSFIATGISPLTLKRAQEKINSTGKDSCVAPKPLEKPF